MRLFNHNGLLFNDMLQLEEFRRPVGRNPPPSHEPTRRIAREPLSVGAASEGPRASGISMSLVKKKGCCQGVNAARLPTGS